MRNSLTTIMIAALMVSSAVRSLRSSTLSRRVVRNLPGQLKISPSAHLCTAAGTQPETKDYYTMNPDDTSVEVGDYGVLRSDSQPCRKFASVKTLGMEEGAQPGEEVWVRGRISSLRAKGNACFLVIRSEGMFTVQALHFKDKEDPEPSKALIKFIRDLPLESVVDIKVCIFHHIRMKTLSTHTQSCSTRPCTFYFPVSFFLSLTLSLTLSNTLMRAPLSGLWNTGHSRRRRREVVFAVQRGDPDAEALRGLPCAQGRHSTWQPFFLFPFAIPPLPSVRPLSSLYRQPSIPTRASLLPPHLTFNI
jgi:hypothetical protein